MQPPPLSVTVAPPLWSTAPRFLPFHLDYPQGYQHMIQADGGYWSMSFRVTGNQVEIEDWLLDGLGRHIVVKDDALVTCFEGFVNEVAGGLGGLSETHGPLIDVGNRVYMVYTPLFGDTSPANLGAYAAGTRAWTGTVNDTDSQSRWGIQYKVLSAGTLTQLEAEYLRGAWLGENSEPAVSQEFRGGGEVGATINCLGYCHLMTWPYNQMTNSGTVNVSTKIIQVLNAAGSDPNNLFPSDVTHIATNTLQVEQWECEDNLAHNLIQSLVALGDAANNRYTYGIYGGRVPWYQMAPTDLAYNQYLQDPAQRILTPNGLEVQPWNVLPGRWLMYPDHYVGRLSPADMRRDPRYEFIESVSYNSEAMPAVSHVGGRVRTLPQLLARWGMANL